MYRQIINELNRFLNHINIPGAPLNPDVFQAVLVKKLSNQNIIKDKRRINAGDTVSTVNQTHIDITGRQGMLFFFEELNSVTTSPRTIDIDLYKNNLKYLREIDHAVGQTDTSGNTYFSRRTVSVPAHLPDLGTAIHSCAYKKYGHTGDQVQINIPDPGEAFTQLQKTAFLDDALVMLRYDYLRYAAILIPSELCGILYSITNTHGNQNINFVAQNPSYDPASAHQLQSEILARETALDDIDADILQHILTRNLYAGTDVNKIVKTRVAQGSFRRLLLLDRHQCSLCDVSTTSVLRASHIKEWADSSREERIDADNGLLLCANHDALFDRHQISFEPDTGALCISASIDARQRAALSLPDSFHLAMSARMKAYMQVHYKKFLENENE